MIRGAVRVLCTPEVAAGFALAGIDPVAMDPAEAAPGPPAMLADPGTAVVLVEDRLWDAIPEAARRRLGAAPRPLIVPFPGPAWAPRPGAAEAYVVELLRRVIGYRVRLR